jgi:hypothetical protein
MQELFDIICSFVIGGVILVLLLGFNFNIVEGAATQVYKLSAQTYLTAVTDILENDFRKLGYNACTSSHDSSITFATDDKLTFKSDINDDGTVELLQYYLDEQPVQGFPNPRLHVLYRVVNGTSQAMDVGITSLVFSYYDRSGQPLLSRPVASPSAIRSIKVAMILESKVPYDTTYSGVCWERVIYPKNLR